MKVIESLKKECITNNVNTSVEKKRYFDNLFDRLIVATVSYRWDYLGETYG